MRENRHRAGVGGQVRPRSRCPFGDASEPLDRESRVALCGGERLDLVEGAGEAIALDFEFVAAVEVQREHDLHLFGSRSRPVEADAPVVVDTDAVGAGSVAFELLQSVAGRNSEIADLIGGVESLGRVT